MKINLLNAWIKGTVISIKAVGNEKFYKIRLDNQKQGPRLRSKYLAYENPASVIVPVGTRIIGKFLAENIFLR